MMNLNDQPGVVLQRKLLFFLALSAGLGVANVYYLQPALQLIQVEFGAPSEQIGLIPTLTQIGYAAGMLFLAPLGDILPRRNMIFIKSLLLAFTLVLAGYSNNLYMLCFIGIAIGLLSSVGQDFVPIAAQLSPETTRGHIVGIVTTGILTGILLSRTLSGVISDALGWRAMQLIAAAFMLMVAIIARNSLPYLPPVNKSTQYSFLMKSLWSLLCKHRSLKLAIITQALLASTLGAFWSTLAMVIAAPPYNETATIAGTFGIAGAAGAIGATVFGKFADAKGPILAIRTGCILVALSFLGMWILSGSLIILAIGAMVFDLGVMAALVSHQYMINSIDPQARSRLNGLLMAGAMCGMAVGAAAGSFAWAHFEWVGICMFCIISSVLGLVFSLFHHNHGAYRHV
ncbi:MFS transporter [Xenorhabdus poinarii]|nr:MFS transporter [Xenorhabdus poinarii]